MKGNRHNNEEYSFRNKINTPILSNNMDQTSDNIYSLKMKNTMSLESSKQGTDK